MRKLVSVFLVVAILCGLGFSIPVYAEDATYEYLPAHVDCRSEILYPGGRIALYSDYFTDGAVPAGTTLKFQWYKNTVDSNEGGTAIPLSEANSQGSEYIPNTSQVGTTYYYAILTYTPSGGEPTLYKSDAMKVTVEANPNTHPLASLLTPAEASGWMRPTTSQEVLDFYKMLAANSEGRIRMEVIGKTTQGRDIAIAIMGKPAPASPADVPEDKAVVEIDASVHGGEIEGKETMMIFSRELAMGLHDDLLEDIVIVCIVNLNPDGNDALGRNRNNSQYTPKLVGTATNQMGGNSYYNVNRDMAKLDAPEGRARVYVLNTWNPIAAADLHGTNGTMQRHMLETRTNLQSDEYEPLMLYNRDYFTELALGTNSWFLERTGWVTAPYGDFVGFNASQGYAGYADGDIGGTWRQGSSEYARFGTNYVGMRNRIVLLFEAYSHAPAPTRVDIHYYSVLSFLMAIQQEKDTIKALEAEADAYSLNRINGLDPEKDVVTLLTKLTILDKGDGNNGTLPIVKSYVSDPNNNNRVIQYNLTDEEGVRSGTVFAGLKDYVNVRHESYFEPVLTVPLGAYYLIEKDCVEAIDLLQTHGIEMAQLTAPVTVKAGDFQWYSVTNRARSSYENHNMNQLTGTWETTTNAQVFPAGTYVVSSAQILGSLAAYIIEPGSPDGIVAWNKIDSQMENYAETVRADYTSTLASGSTIAIPIFKIADFSVLESELGVLRVKVETDAHLVQAGDYFRVNSYFNREVNSNAATLTYTFDNDKFEFKGYEGTGNVESIDIKNENGKAKIIVMVPSYAMKELGSLQFQVREGAVFTNNRETINLTVDYALKDGDTGDKTVETLSGSVSFLALIPDYLKGDTNGDGIVDLIDLSNIIDLFGVKKGDAKWDPYLDFNNNGEIDINDIAFIARQIL